MKLTKLLLTVLSIGIATAAEKPNIILIISDDQGYSDYGFMGSKVAQTPHLDAMAAQSQVYTRGYVMPVCSPSLACLLTGKLPHAHGITGNDLAETKKKEARDPLAKQLFSNSLILPKALTKAGYATFQTGKLWNATFSEVGFTDGMTDKEGRHGGDGLTIGRESMDPIFKFIDGATAEKKPFFIWYAPFLPHTPHNPPERLLSKYQGKGLNEAAEKYFAMVEWLDETCGQLDDYLVKNKLADNTVILYLADNGWEAENARGSKISKLTPYELGIRTPMFVRWPGKVKPMKDESTLASVIDFAPTILKIAGAKAPADLPGLDLTDHAAMTGRKAVFSESYTHDIHDLKDPTKSLVAKIVISGDYKLLIPGDPSIKRLKAHGPNEITLFDLKADPKETTNLAAKNPAEVQRLTKLIEENWKSN